MESDRTELGEYVFDQYVAGALARAAKGIGLFLILSCLAVALMVERPAMSPEPAWDMRAQQSLPWHEVMAR
ncbi:MAG: hypothetical protein OIF40_12220 [Mangrovicoccus sp.]|nr:hypothetical protein [Mangrovicoccus sp.]